MDLHLVVLPFVLAFSLASTNQCVSSPGSSIELSLHSLKNASGHWITTVDTRRFTMKENPRELTVNVHQETRLCDSNEIEQVVSVAVVYPSLEGNTMRGATQPAAPSSTANNNTTSTITTPKSCPHSGYRLLPELNCYKAFTSEGKIKTWSNARGQCRRDGGDLMVMETDQERKEVYIPLHNAVNFSNYPWVGVHIPQGGEGWTTIRGEPALSTWWAPGYPDKRADRECASATPTGLLGNVHCAYTLPFICEIPL